MSKVLRTAGMVVAAVALVATTAGLAAPAVAATATTAASAGGIAGISAATLTAIGTYGSLAAGVLSAASAATAPGFSAQGSKTTFTTNPQSGLPYAMGRTRMSGLRVYARTYDGFKQKSKDDILAFVAMLSIAGPIQGIEQFTADGEEVTFETATSVGDAQGRFYAYMAQRRSLGEPGAPALDMSFGGKFFPGWTSAHKLSGIAHAQWALRFDKDGDLFGAGAPEPAWIGQWVKVYDPRKDSTYPGGSGSHRALDESTYEWSDNPGLHALTWALGRWQNGKRVCGIGAPVDTIRIAEFVECANVCDANGWTAGGVEWTTDSKWDTLKRILQAGGAKPTQTGAMIGCLVSTPRTAIATIESRHLLDSLSLAMTKSRRDRFNSVIPRYVDEDSDWAVVSGTAITVPDYVTADGGQRTKEIDFPLVQVFSGDEATQPGQLAAYEIVNSREAGPFTFTTGPEWIGLKTGDVIYLDVPEEGLDNQPVLVTKRAIDPATGKVSFTVETETYSKHAFALGQTTVPPAPFSLTAPDLKPAEPGEIGWSITGTTSGEGFPALLVAGESEMPSADALVIDYRLHDAAEWTNAAIVSAVEPIRHVIAPLESETAYDVRISYRVGSIDGNYTVFSNVITGVGKLTTIESQVGDHEAEIAQLEADTAQAELDIAAAQANITSLQSDAAALQTDLTAAQADILSAQADILANSDDIATVNTTLSSHGASITSLQTTASSQAGQIATLESTVSTQGTSITSNATAITTLQGNVASLTTTVTAGSRPNLLENGGFENGLTGWNAGGSWSVENGYGWGRYAYIPAVTGVALLEQIRNVEPGVTLTIAADMSKGGSGSGYLYVDLVFYDGSGGALSDADPIANKTAGDFSVTGDRQLYYCTATAPSGTVTVGARFVVVATSGTISAAVKGIKMERGSFPTPYSSEASIVQSFTALSTAQGDIASLETSLSTANANISTNASAISGINTSIASINSTLSTQGASITSNASAITTLQGNVSTLTTKVSAGMANLVVNGGFENGLAGWSGSGFAWANNGWGPQAYIAADGTKVLQSDYFPVFQNAPYTISGDWAFFASSGVVYLDLLFFDGSNNQLLDGAQNPRSPGSDFHYDGAGRDAIKATSVAPNGAVKAKARFVVEGASGVTFAGIRQIKVEQGSVATAYSNEASVTQSFSTLSTLNSQYASLSSTVSTQGVTITSQQTAITTIEGNVTTLFGRAGVKVDVNGRMTGWETNNNGQTGNFIIHADYFAIEKPGGGEGTTFANGAWKVTDTSGAKRVQLGNLAA